MVGRPLATVKTVAVSRFPLSLILLLGLCIPARSHELPDGEIERRVQVSVKRDGVLIEYSLGMNETTLEAELRKLGWKPAPTVSDKWNQYKKLVASSLAKNIQVTINGEEQPVKPLRAVYSGWSHRHLSCLVRVDAKLTDPRAAITVTDRNFLDTPGKYRLAMKARRGAKLEDSSVPLLVSRAQPVELVKLSKKEKHSATRAAGTFVFAEIGKRSPENGEIEVD